MRDRRSWSTEEKPAATENADVPDNADIDGRVADCAVQRLAAVDPAFCYNGTETLGGNVHG